MRHVFITDLVKELLGPRKGATEDFVFADEPRNEYTTGQLIPRESTLERDPDEDEMLGEGASGGEEDTDDAAPSYVNQALIDAGQNFRRVPSSMGLSFVLSHKPQKGDLRVCITWGRYHSREDKIWIREPNFWIVDCTDEVLASGGKSPDGAIQIDFKVTSLPKTSHYKVSVYISSLIKPKDSDRRRPKTEEIIFQPEIRVMLKERKWLSELGELSFATEDDKEWRISSRQYDNLNIYARGHLCGAYWDEIDPQRVYEERVLPEPDLPFKWIDGRYFLTKHPEIEPFFTPHLRTDFIPLYAAPAIQPERDSQINFNVDAIAKCADFNSLYEIINPFVSSYESWIKGLMPSSDLVEIDKEIIKRNKEAVDRMRSGMNFLREDNDAFLAFLFMNKVMAKQYAWGKKEGSQSMSWRPFQIGFILLSLESAVKRTVHREICDTIWFPTGGGKTEAYLGLAAFTLAYRRRVSAQDSDGSSSGDGTCVISRYTLRLLTIQQFRRALKMIMACEVLRCSQAGGASVGWLPTAWKSEKGYVWGHSPFSIGLWVGSAVTPNVMKGEGYIQRQIAQGAISILSKPALSDETDPAQILECPCCGSILSFPIDGAAAGELILKLHVSNKPRFGDQVEIDASSHSIKVTSITYEPNTNGKAGYLTLNLNLTGPVTANSIHRWWEETAEKALETHLNSFSAARPGYVRVQSGRRGGINDYEIRCPDPDCEINQVIFKHKLPSKSEEWSFVEGHPCFALPDDMYATSGAPISAITVDEKLYQYPPSMLISTIDKFAQMAFTNKAAALFGRVRSFDTGMGKGFSQEAPNANRCPVSQFEAPLLIIQDELHLLDGPLGSTFGLFETVVDELCDKPKYIASSATIRNSLEQVACIMGRKSNVFPPANLDVSDGFFIRTAKKDTHPLDESLPGRLFLGLAFPGRAPETPMLRLWGRLLQTSQDQVDFNQTILDSENRKNHLEKLDHFWTLICYFNAVRELARGETLIRQDIPQYLDKLKKQNNQSKKREDILANYKNLSSQTSSSELPGILAKMERTLQSGDALSAVAATSMFGTGVDVARLSLMVVHGQPKSSSQYIQAVGRIGRRQAGLAVVFFRVSKPRDLNHYEYFTGYHRKLPIAVEPITVKPLAPKALDRSIGSLLAILFRNWLRNKPSVPLGIDAEGGAGAILDLSSETLEVIIDIFQKKWESQPKQRQPDNEHFILYVRSQINRWKEYARRQNVNGDVLQYTKGNMIVLGESETDSCVFDKVPKSLREVEPMIKVYTGE